MKSLLVLLVAVAAATASFDRTKITPIKGFQSGVHPRIVGGEEAEPHSVPYQVALFIPYQDGRAFCGGSLISDSWVLTAAHCGELSNNITVVLGAHNVTDATEPEQQVRSSKSVHVHGGWDSTTLTNDIAVIELDSPVEINDFVHIVRLPSRAEQGDHFENRDGVATGWGKDSDAAEGISEVLRTVTLPIISNAECRIEFGLIGIALPLHDTNLCISGKGGKSTCNGDSGGPLMLPLNNNKPTVVGLTSFGISFGCEKNYPGVFTRITSYLDWISMTTGIIIQGDE